MNINLSDINKEDVNTAENLLIELIRAEYPNVDLSKGTVLRDLLIRPASELYAVNTLRYDELADSYSIKQIYDTNTPDYNENLDRLLSNFKLERSKGSKASGQVIIKVMFDSMYDLRDRPLTDVNGLVYNILDTQLLPTNSKSPDGIVLSKEGDHYFAVIGIEAALTGDEYNKDKGVTLNMEHPISGFIIAETTTSISGGFTEETPREVINRIPVALSSRSLDSHTSIQASLQDRFPYIKDLSVAGMGDKEQLRDKHYVVSVGGRVDIYPKTFYMMDTKVLKVKGVADVKNGLHCYKLRIDKDDAPGYYMVKSVYDVTSEVNYGSYSFDEERGCAISNTFHDFSTAGYPEEYNSIETLYTAYQTSDIYVYGAAPSSSKSFYVEVYVAPGIKEIQDYLDLDSVRSVYSDMVVRSPLVGITKVRCLVYPKYGVYDLDTDAITHTIWNTVNRCGFGDILSKSKIISDIMAEHPVDRVDMSNASNGTALLADFRVGDGTIVQISGENLDVNTVANGSLLFTQNTTVYSITEDDIFVQKVI